MSLSLMSRDCMISGILAFYISSTEENRCSRATSIVAGIILQNSFYIYTRLQAAWPAASRLVQA